MSNTSQNMPSISGGWTVIVEYVVQPRTRARDIWERAAMTREEWDHLNPNHPSSKPLQTGDEVVIKDPIATCEMYKRDAIAYSDGVSVARFFNWNCEEVYGAFKPLRAFTKSLGK